MSSGEIIKLHGLESVEVVRAPQGVKLNFRVGGIPVMVRTLDLATARRLGDALGFASNDIARTSPSLPNGASAAAEPFVGGRDHAA